MARPPTQPCVVGIITPFHRNRNRAESKATWPAWPRGESRAGSRTPSCWETPPRGPEAERRAGRGAGREDWPSDGHSPTWPCKPSGRSTSRPCTLSRRETRARFRCSCLPRPGSLGRLLSPKGGPEKGRGEGSDTVRGHHSAPSCYWPTSPSHFTGGKTEPRRAPWLLCTTQSWPPGALRWAWVVLHTPSRTGQPAFLPSRGRGQLSGHQELQGVQRQWVCLHGLHFQGHLPEGK